MKKVTDLEKFTLEEIFRPYQTMIGFGEERLRHLPIKLSEMTLFAEQNPEWWKIVKNRIIRMEVWFPDYIKHDIVTLINSPLT